MDSADDSRRLKTGVQVNSQKCRMLVDSARSIVFARKFAPLGGFYVRVGVWGIPCCVATTRVHSSIAHRRTVSGNRQAPGRPIKRLEGTAAANHDRNLRVARCAGLSHSPLQNVVQLLLIADALTIGSHNLITSLQPDHFGKAVGRHSLNDEPVVPRRAKLDAKARQAALSALLLNRLRVSRFLARLPAPQRRLTDPALLACFDVLIEHALGVGINEPSPGASIGWLAKLILLRLLLLTQLIDRIGLSLGGLRPRGPLLIQSALLELISLTQQIL